MKISVIIATLDRPDDLRKCLAAIKHNTHQPEEVIIVEQGNVSVTEHVAAKIDLDIKVLFLADKSLTKARNIGIKYAQNDLYCFVDDDVVLGDTYLQFAVEYFKNPNNATVLGINGKDIVHTSRQKNKKDYIRQCIGVLFWRSAFTNYNRVLLSGHNVLRNNAQKEQVIEWMSGACMVFRRPVFDEFLFDNRFIRWSFNEDVSLSHLVQSKYPKSLRYLPQLQYCHNESKSQRLLNEQIIKMSVVYRYIFWSEQIKPKSILAPLAYFWAQVGYCVLTIAEYKSVKTVRVLLKSYTYLILNRRKISNEETDYNSFILKT